jgi:ATP:corrinoid adenosyltransferase
MLIDAADLVTEMRMIKHPYQTRHRGTAGIEL